MSGTPSTCSLPREPADPCRPGRPCLPGPAEPRPAQAPADSSPAGHVCAGAVPGSAGRHPYADQFVVKGGMLLAARDARRPTVDGDFLARRLSNDESSVLDRVVQIASTLPPIEDASNSSSIPRGQRRSGSATSTPASESEWMRRWAPARSRVVGASKEASASLGTVRTRMSRRAMPRATRRPSRGPTAWRACRPGPGSPRERCLARRCRTPCRGRPTPGRPGARS